MDYNTNSSIFDIWLQVTRNFNYIDSFHIYGPSFALRQKMLNFIQNLEYYMTFEVLEPNWEEMISKIKSGKVANVDQVRQQNPTYKSRATLRLETVCFSPVFVNTINLTRISCLNFDISFYLQTTKWLYLISV